MFEKKVFIPFALITLINFISGFALQMTVPTLSVYLKSLGFPLQFLGFAALISALTALLFRPISAAMSHKVGAISTALLGSVVYLVAYLLFIVLKQPMFIVMTRALQGIGVGLFVTGLGTAIAQIVPHEHMLTGMNIYSLFAAATGALGPFVGMMLIADGDFTDMFMWAALLSGLAIVLMIVLMKWSPKHVEDDSAHDEAIPSIFKSEAVFPSLMVLTLMFFQAGLVAFLAIYGQEIGIQNVGFFFLYNFVGLIVSRFVVNRLIHSFDLSVILVGLTLGYSVINVLIVIQPSVWTWTLLSIAHGFVFNVLATLYNTMAIKNVHFKQKAKANALYFAAIDLGFFLGGVLWGFVAKAWGSASIFIITAGLSFIIMNYGAYFAHKKHIQF